MCGYQIGTVECRGDGYCWDADHDGYDPNDLSWPCPACNTEAYLAQAKKEAETTGYFMDMSGSGNGVTIWEGAVAVARKENPEQVDAILISIGRVDAVNDDESSDSDDFEIKTFCYAN